MCARFSSSYVKLCFSLREILMEAPQKVKTRCSKWLFFLFIVCYFKKLIVHLSS